MNVLTYTLTALAVTFAVPAFAGGTIDVTDAYARFLPGAMAGAAFMQIENHGTEPDRLVGVASDIAKRVELHTHKAGSDGVMQMMHVPEGVEIPAGGSHALARGGDHVMFMGLAERPADGAVVTVVLTFEKAGEVMLDIPVDNAR